MRRPVPVIVIPNSLREGLAKLSPEAREVALKLIRAKIRRVRKAGPSKDLLKTASEATRPEKPEPQPTPQMPTPQERTGLIIKLPLFNQKMTDAPPDSSGKP